MGRAGAAVRRRTAIAATLGLAGLALLVPVGQAPAARAAGTASAVTVTGSGPFAGLSVTVDQTTNLINQVVRISWTGAAPTRPATDAFDVNYLQIMQCWGDDPAGPDRTQCQYGGIGFDARAGSNTGSRQLDTVGLTDPAETITKTGPGSVYVPFAAVTGETVAAPTPNTNPYYDGSSTNELPLARTRADGGGEEFFEIETAREAPGLGCGKAVTDSAGTTGTHGCWLVIVPRGDVEVDGRPPANSLGRLATSPLSMSNWRHRMVVKLDFQPVDARCVIGAKERATAGQEMIAEAVGSWQPALCTTTKAVFGYSQITDDQARTQLQSTDPGLDFVTGPVDPTTLAEGTKPVYAPVAVGAVTIAFNVQRQYNVTRPDLTSRNGERITEIKLTPRLVAKLITQSYRLSVVGGQTYLQGNPADLTSDPEFTALNPDFADQYFVASIGTSDILAPVGLSDAMALLWRYVAADAQARAFIAGTADPHGMKVNPNYLNFDLAQSGFPKADQSCFSGSSDPNAPPLCESDYRPYVNNMHEGARSAARGDTQKRGDLDATVSPPVYKKSAAAPNGMRAVLAFSDGATAGRYALVTAQLRNASGRFVSPGADGMAAAVAAMKPGPAAGVLAPDPAITAAAAYPLTSVTYAATVPSALDAASRKDYAAFLRYAAGPGQVQGIDPGQLPPGYLPLPDPMRSQTLAVAAAVAAGSGASTPAATGRATGHTPRSASSASSAPAAAPDAVAPPTAAAPTTGTAPATPSTAPPVVQTAARTAASRLGSARRALAGAMGVGAVAAVAGPFLMRRATRRR